MYEFNRKREFLIRTYVWGGNIEFSMFVSGRCLLVLSLFTKVINLRLN